MAVRVVWIVRCEGREGVRSGCDGGEECEVVWK